MSYKIKKRISLLMAICLLVSCFGNINFGDVHNHNVKHASAASHVHSSACYNGTKHTHVSACKKTTTYLCGSAIAVGSDPWSTCLSCGSSFRGYATGPCTSCGGQMSVSSITNYQCSNCGSSCGSGGHYTTGTSIVCGKTESDYYNGSGNVVNPTCNQVVTSISATSPTATTYLNEPVNTTGMSVTAYYLDGQSANISNYTITADTSTSGKKNATITYNGYIDNASTTGSKTATVSITVIPKTKACTAGRGHADYQLNADGSDGGCPICNQINGVYNIAQGHYNDLVGYTNSLKNMKTNLSIVRDDFETTLSITIIESDRKKIEKYLSSINKNLDTLTGYIDNANEFINQASSKLSEIQASATKTVSRAEELSNEILVLANTVKSYKVASSDFENDANSDKNDGDSINNKAEEIEKNRVKVENFKDEINSFKNEMNSNKSQLLEIKNTLNNYLNIIIITNDSNIVKSYLDIIDSYIKDIDDFIEFADSSITKADEYINFMNDSTDKTIEQTNLLVTEIEQLKVQVLNNKTTSDNYVADANEKQLLAYNFVKKANDIAYSKQIYDNMNLQLNTSKTDYSNNRVVESDYVKLVDEINQIKDKAVNSKKTIIQGKIDEINALLELAYTKEDDIEITQVDMNGHLSNVFDIIQTLDDLDYLTVGEKKVVIEGKKSDNDILNTNVNSFIQGIKDCYDQAVSIRDWVLAQKFVEEKQQIEDKEIIINDNISTVEDIIIKINDIESQASQSIDNLKKLLEEIKAIYDSGILETNRVAANDFLDKAEKLLLDGQAEHTNINTEIVKVIEYKNTLMSYKDLISDKVSIAINTDDDTLYQSTVKEINELLLLANTLIEKAEESNTFVSDKYQIIQSKYIEMSATKDEINTLHNNYIYANKVLDTLKENIDKAKKMFIKSSDIMDEAKTYLESNSSFLSIYDEMYKLTDQLENHYFDYKSYISIYDTVSNYAEIQEFETKVNSKFATIEELYNQLVSLLKNIEDAAETIEKNKITIEEQLSKLKELINDAKQKLEELENRIESEDCLNDSLSEIIDSIKEEIENMEKTFQIVESILNESMGNLNLDDSNKLLEDTRKYLETTEISHDKVLELINNANKLIDDICNRRDGIKHIEENIHLTEEMLTTVKTIIEDINNKSTDALNDKYKDLIKSLLDNILLSQTELKANLDTHNKLLEEVVTNELYNISEGVSNSDMLLKQAQDIFNNISKEYDEMKEVFTKGEEEKEELDKNKDKGNINEDTIKDIIDKANDILEDAKDIETKITEDKTIVEELIEDIIDKIKDLTDIKDEIEELNKKLQDTEDIDIAKDLVDQGNILIDKAKDILDEIIDINNTIKDIYEKQQSNQNGNSGNGSSNENPSDVEISIDKPNSDILEKIFGDVSGFTFNTQTGKIYYNKKKLNAKEEVKIKELYNDEWNTSITFKNCREYSVYMFYFKDKDNHVYRITLRNFVVDYQTPTTILNLKEVDNAYPMNDKSKVIESYNVLTTKSSLFHLTLSKKNKFILTPNIEYGVSGKRSLMYQLNTSSNKNSKWINVDTKTNTIELPKNFNGKIVIKAIDNANNSSIINISNTIDKKKPTIKNLSNNKTYKKNVKISYSDANGIKKAVISYNSGSYLDIKTGTTLKKSGSYVLKVTDCFGNTKTVKFKIKK